MLAYLAILLSDAPCANVILQFFAPLHRTRKLCMFSWREIDQSPPLTFLHFFLKINGGCTTSFGCKNTKSFLNNTFFGGKYTKK